ncbi:MAG: type ISP restriction/modification enzyme, partial [Nitrospiria bacterium]
MASLAEESHLAGRVKKETQILVILGNPPYSGHSANPSAVVRYIAAGQYYRKTTAKGPKLLKAGKKGVRLVEKTFIGNLLKDYYQVEGRSLGERNPKWLQDDYVKFIRFAQWKIEQTGEGVLGFITNHGYLDNPTFRGMRQSLMQSFERIYLLNLHGNSLKKERCPDGSKDKNVFDIRQGVAIGLFIKKPGLQRKVCHADLWGLRDDKYRWLEENDMATTRWQEIRPKSPFYLFVPRDEALLDRYQEYPKATEILPVNSVGIVTSRDHFVIDFEKEALMRRIRMFRDKNLPDEVIRQTFDLKDKRHWKMSAQRKAITADKNWEEKVIQILYRPFDVRWIFYDD